MEDKQNLHEIDIQLFGPSNTPYENGTFWVHIELPKRYPLDPPKIEMKTRILHPIINKKGKICLSILERWESSNCFGDCLDSLYQALENPKQCLVEAINDDALCLCVENFKQFQIAAKEYTDKFATSKVCYL